MALTGSFGLSDNLQQNADELGIPFDQYKAILERQPWGGSSTSQVGGQGNQAWNTSSSADNPIRQARDYILDQQRMGLLASGKSSSSTTDAKPASNRVEADPTHTMVNLGASAGALNERAVYNATPGKSDPKSGAGPVEAKTTTDVPGAPKGPWDTVPGLLVKAPTPQPTQTQHVVPTVQANAATIAPGTATVLPASNQQTFANLEDAVNASKGVNVPQNYQVPSQFQSPSTPGQPPGAGAFSNQGSQPNQGGGYHMYGVVRNPATYHASINTPTQPNYGPGADTALAKSYAAQQNALGPGADTALAKSYAAQQNALGPGADTALAKNYANAMNKGADMRGKIGGAASTAISGIQSALEAGQKQTEKMMAIKGPSSNAIPGPEEFGGYGRFAAQTPTINQQRIVV